MMQIGAQNIQMRILNLSPPERTSTVPSFFMGCCLHEQLPRCWLGYLQVRLVCFTICIRYICSRVGVTRTEVDRNRSRTWHFLPLNRISGNSVLSTETLSIVYTENKFTVIQGRSNRIYNLLISACNGEWTQIYFVICPQCGMLSSWNTPPLHYVQNKSSFFTIGKYCKILSKWTTPVIHCIA